MEPIQFDRITLAIVCVISLAPGLRGHGQAAGLPPSTTMPSTCAFPDPTEEDIRPVVQWVELGTEAVLFTERDIVRFDWERQLFQLSRERAMDLLSRPLALKTDFSVRDARGEIYRGCFMSSVSSFTYDGPTIPDGMFGVKPPLYHVAGGYPGSGSHAGVRFDPRLKDALLRAGVIGGISNSSQVVPIEKVFLGWYGDRDGVRVGIEFFPETFRIGRDALIVFRFTHGRNFDSRSDRIWVCITLAEKLDVFAWEPWRTTQSIEIHPALVRPSPCQWQGTRVSRLRLSEPGKNDWAGRTMLPGQAELSAVIRVERKTAQGMDKLGSWTVPAHPVEILPVATGSNPSCP